MKDGGGGVAARLALLVALAGVLPLFVVGAIAVEALRNRSVDAARDTLRSVAEQAAGRIHGYIAAQRETLRTVAGAVGSAPDAARRLEEVALDAPSLAEVTLVGPETPPSRQPKKLDPHEVARARAGSEEASEIYLDEDATPTMDLCTPARGRHDYAVCARLDLLELWRFVHRIKLGVSGYALAFDKKGKLIASGAGVLRGAILAGDDVIPESASARLAADNLRAAPTRYVGPLGQEVLAGWAAVPDLGWTVVVEQPASEALQGAKAAQWVLLGVSLMALALSLFVGVQQSRRVLADLEREERWRTAGRIAAGITHDLGHRVTILQQTVGLAETGDPIFLPRIRDNLKAEVATLRKFVADFADLSRDIRITSMLPLDLDAFAESIRRSGQPHAEKMEIALEVKRSEGGAWVSGDRYLLERAALNLVSNAVEASRPGSVVTIEVGAEGQTAVFAVVDRGSGVDPDRLPRIFDAFASTKRTGAHVGMGLPNVKRIVEAHGGRVSATSAVGEGSIFRMAFPRIPVPEDA